MKPYANVRFQCGTFALTQTDIEVDGGVGPSTLGDCCKAGANMIVSGTAITQAQDAGAVIAEMKRIGETLLKI